MDKVSIKTYNKHVNTVNTYLIGAFMNDCTIRWRSIEGFSEAVDYVRSLEPSITISKDSISASPNICGEIGKLMQKPTRLLLLFNVNDWIELIRGLYDFNGELLDPEPSLDMPNLVLTIRVPSKTVGLVIRIVLKFLGINSNAFPGNDGKIYVVIHDRDSIARFVKTIKPRTDPSLNIALRDKWVRHYENYGKPIIEFRHV